MTGSLLNSLQHKLPWKLNQGLGRLRLKWRDPEKFRQLQALRTLENDGRYTLKPFDDHRCIFVHIPKCAGVSLSLSLFGNLAGGHRSIIDYSQVFSVKELEDYFCFTVVRNPWDRLASAWFYLKAGGMNRKDNEWSDAHLSAFDSFDEFVRRWVTRSNIKTWKHFRPQYLYICDQQGKPRMDFIGYYENLENDFRYIQTTLGIDASLQHLNRSKGERADYRDLYNDETRAIVAEAYREDIELLAYDFNGVKRA
jgi:hypothetical protein